METFAVTVFPVAKPDEWRAWADSIASGDRAAAHRQMMRRLGHQAGAHLPSGEPGRGCDGAGRGRRRAGPRARAAGRSGAEPAV